MSAPSVKTTETEEWGQHTGIQKTCTSSNWLAPKKKKREREQFHSRNEHVYILVLKQLGLTILFTHFCISRGFRRIRYRQDDKDRPAHTELVPVLVQDQSLTRSLLFNHLSASKLAPDEHQLLAGLEPRSEYVRGCGRGYLTNRTSAKICIDVINITQLKRSSRATGRVQQWPRLTRIKRSQETGADPA